MNDNLTLELPNFEGPLDLLLHLIKSQKIDIYDIPISQITQRYLNYLEKMQQLNLQIAGEYFVMASTLLRIKSQSLLPQNDFVNDEDEVTEDPRNELVQQLVQYSVFKKISAYFKKRDQESPVTMAKEISTPENKKIQPLPLGQITANELANTFVVVLERLKLRHPNTASIKVAKTSVKEMGAYLERLVQNKHEVSFFKCAKVVHNLGDFIGLFLAMLELCKNKKIWVTQAQEFGDLYLKGIDLIDH